MLRIILIVALLSLTSCAGYYRAQADADAAEIARKQAEVDQIVAKNHAYAREQGARISMNVTVCIAKANAAVPGAGKMIRPLTLHDRARLIAWAKVSDACFLERGGAINPRNYPTMDAMKQCDRRSRAEMPSAGVIERNDYIDDCLEAAGFTLPGH